MLQELVNYAKWLKKDFKELFEGNLTEGLHIGIEVRKKEEKYIFNYKSRKASCSSTFICSSFGKAFTLPQGLQGIKR